MNFPTSYQLFEVTFIPCFVCEHTVLEPVVLEDTILLALRSDCFIKLRGLGNWRLHFRLKWRFYQLGPVICVCIMGRSSYEMVCATPVQFALSSGTVFVFVDLLTLYALLKTRFIMLQDLLRWLSGVSFRRILKLAENAFLRWSKSNISHCTVNFVLTTICGLLTRNWTFLRCIFWQIQG